MGEEQGTAGAADDADAEGTSPLDALPDGVLALDASAAVVSASAPARRLLGLDLQAGDRIPAEASFVDLDGRVLEPGDLPPMVALRTATPSSDVLVGAGPPDRRRWLSFSTALRHDQRGRPTGAVATVRSATAAKRAHDLQAAVRRLAVTVAAAPAAPLDDLLATVGQAVDADRVLLVHVDRAGGALHRTHAWHRRTESAGRDAADPADPAAPTGPAAIPLDLVAGLLGRLAPGSPLVVPDRRTAAGEAHGADRVDGTATGAAVFVPVRVDGRLDGFLLAGWDDPHQPPADVVDFAAHAGELVAAHLARSRADERAEATRRERDGELALAHHRARLFLDVLPDLFVRIDATDRLLDYYVPHTDLPTDLLDDIVGHSVIDVLAPERGDELREVLRAARETGTVQVMDFEWVADDHVRVFEGRYLAEADGTVISVVRDVTGTAERDHVVREQAAALAATNAELHRLVQERDEFLAGVSHELRTPLNAILGLTEVLLEDEGDPVTAGQGATLRTIESSGRHLLALINDLLDLSRLRAGGVDLVPAEVAVGDPCRMAVELILPRAERKGLTVELVNAAGDLVIVAEERRLRQVLLNLLDNAVKFTDPGGSVGVRVWSPDAEHVALSVWDTGVGIPAADHPRIFQPFTQLDGRRRGATWRGPDRRSAGSGLGLSLVERLVTLHGGWIELDSMPGRGSRFTVVLPVRGPGDHVDEGRTEFRIGLSTLRAADLPSVLR